jgi:hypothetical protein
MPEASEYLFTHVGFTPNEVPLLTLQKDESFIDFLPTNHTLTLRFNTDQRFCVGWGNLASGERFVCPEHQAVDAKYEQCAACQQRTGFNPAFYHATSVSKQQEVRNQQPHILYLAYFGEGIVKVGISYAARGNSRLLEQGCRSALILDVFPSALIARKYEAQIAALSGIVENIQTRKKIALLLTDTPQQTAGSELLAAKERIQQELGVTFAQNHILQLDTRYFPAVKPDLASSDDCSKQHLISGVATGMLGSLLFCELGGRSVFLPLKKYIGFLVHVSSTVAPLTLPARQTSLF